ncbi:conserved hypothetical protein [Hahella chejuensis KCTC 2396]|uniref:Solute-binding protein family 3/N-terminal domain-containing protein n=2 Tax=Hahella chejuensis TaxID=158327 RepID=Q2SGX3_HAHCH|nr:transporter substrate-binding domain-containing protein [Hahella chejuensis]ABC30101.1 conserved hypothetical protein [Hahella chejuensis KCTC 2396]
MADTIRVVCESMAIECKLSAFPWRRALKMTEDGDVDGLFAVVKLPEREKYMYVTEPIIESAYGVFVPTSSSLKYSAPVDLDGYTVGAYGPSAASRALEEIAIY